MICPTLLQRPSPSGAASPDGHHAKCQPTCPRGRNQRQRPSQDNPYSEAQFKTLKYMPGFPDRFGSLEDARTTVPRSSPATTARISTAGSGCTRRTTCITGWPRLVRHTGRGARRSLPADPRTIRSPTSPTARTAHRGVDQSTQTPRHARRVRGRTSVDSAHPVSHVR